jgi:hypothetical protein
MPNISKYFFFTFISFLLFSGIIFSQSFIYPDSLDGKYALQFQISDDFQLTNFQGTTFSGKYHIGKREAIRTGISLDFGDAENEFDAVTDTTSDHGKNDQTSFSITINTQYIRYLKGTEDIVFFGGTGPFVTYQNAENTSKVTDDDIVRNIEDTRTTFSIGMDVLVGVEWFFHKAMSLSAEYGLELYYLQSDQETKIDDSTREMHTNYFTVDANSVNFGISVYF